MLRPRRQATDRRLSGCGGSRCLTTLIQTLSRVRLRCLAGVARGLAIGGAVFAVVLMFESAGPTGRLKAASIASAVVVLVIARYWRVSIAAVAREIESTHGMLDNLVITAAELSAHPRPVQAEIRDAIFTQAEERIATVDPARVVPLAQPAGVAAAVLLGCALLASVSPRSGPALPGESGSTSEAPAAGAIVVRITPPAYTARPIENPHRSLAGDDDRRSRVRIEGDREGYESGGM